MSLSPRPTPLPSALVYTSSVESERNLFCPNYDGCLHLAVKQGWEGWTCRHCPRRHLQQGVPQARDYAQSRPGRSEAF